MGASELTLTDSSSTSAVLVRRAKAGDRDAFETLLRQHERMVLRTSLRLLGRMELAQDAAQEVFLRMHKYLGRFDDDRELGPWLYRMVVNVCHDVRRKSGPAAVPLEEVAEPVSGEDVSGEVDGRLDRDRRRELVSRALAALPEKERAALVLRDIEGLPTSEVARILGSSEGTVRSQISTGRVKVKALVQSFLKRRP